MTGKDLYEARILLHLTQSEMAKELGLTIRTLSGYENRESIPLTIQLAVKFLISENKRSEWTLSCGIELWREDTQLQNSYRSGLFFLTGVLKSQSDILEKGNDTIRVDSNELRMLADFFREVGANVEDRPSSDS